MIKNILLQKKLLYFFFILFIIQINNGFTNFYIILKNRYADRMIKNAGYCENQGYGFVKKIYEKYRINISVENFGDYPSSGSYFYNMKYRFDRNFLIFINLPPNIFFDKYKKDYKILENENNCFLLKKI